MDLGKVCILRGDRESSPSRGNGAGLTEHKKVETLKEGWKDRAVQPGYAKGHSAFLPRFLLLPA